jgi:hypothetical protein
VATWSLANQLSICLKTRVCSASHPGRFTPKKYRVPIVHEAVWVLGSVGTCAKNLAPTGIRFPYRPVRSQSLYRLSYPVHVGCRLPHTIRVLTCVCLECGRFMEPAQAQTQAQAQQSTRFLGSNISEQRRNFENRDLLTSEKGK